MPRSGDVLDGRYRLDALVATGGMGEVWRATDVTLGRLVAVKLLRPALLVDPQFDARFQVEARIMAALTHPNVINIYDYGHAPAAAGGGAYLVMSYVDGQPKLRILKLPDDTSRPRRRYTPPIAAGSSTATSNRPTC